jgi:hypothetical protein
MRAELTEQDAIDRTHVEALSSMYKCDGKGKCNNKLYCWVAPQGVHLMIFPAQLKLWSMAINRGDATLEQPTEELLKTLMPVRSGGRNPYRTHSTPKTHANSPQYDDQYRSPYSGFMPYPFPFYPGAMGFPGMPGYPGSNQAMSPTVQQASQDHERSSPPIDPMEEQDPVSRLIKYTNWLMRITPTQAESIKEAQDTLVQQGYSIRVVPSISDDAFKKMGISEGLGLLFKTELDQFKRAERQGKL